MSIFDDPFLARRSSVDSDFEASAYTDGSGASTNPFKEKKESSSEISANRRAFEREMKKDEDLQAELDTFMENQKKADEDGDFTKSEERDAKEAFINKKLGLSKEATLGDVDDLKTEIPSDLEANFRLLPYRGEALIGDVIKLDADLRPVWGAAIVEPLGASILVWDDTLEEPDWVALALGNEGDHLECTATGFAFMAPEKELPDGTADSLLLWDDSLAVPAWVVLEAGIDGYLLQSSGGGIDWGAPPEKELPDCVVGDMLVGDGVNSWDVMDKTGVADGYVMAWDGGPIWSDEYAKVPEATDDYLLYGTATGWAKGTVGTALGLGSTAGMVAWTGSQFEIRELTCSEGYVHQEV